jgi:hypothetical protein
MRRHGHAPASCAPISERVPHLQLHGVSRQVTVFAIVVFIIVHVGDDPPVLLLGRGRFYVGEGVGGVWALTICHWIEIAIYYAIHSLIIFFRYLVLEGRVCHFCNLLFI